MKKILFIIWVLFFGIFVIGRVCSVETTTSLDKKGIKIQETKLNKVNDVKISTLDNENVEISQKDIYLEIINQRIASFSTENVFYFSSDGNDNNDGLSQYSPKKNPVPFIESGNCQVLLKSGDVFYIKKSIKLGTDIMISTYGGNDRAVISLLQNNSATFSIFDKNNNIYSAALNSEYNDMGWLIVDGETDVNWKRVLSYSLKNEGEYYVNQQTGVVYIKSDLNLEGTSFKYAAPSTGLSLAYGNNAIIDNIEIVGAGDHGINIQNYTDVVIFNTFIHHIGGHILPTDQVKYGNGIQVWATGTDNIYIYGNIVQDCFDAGLTAQVTNSKKDSKNIVFCNNFVEGCNYSFEMFQYGNQYKVQDVVVCDNIFSEAKDITNGYRLTKSGTNFTAHFCLWHCENPNTNVLIKNNLAVTSQVYFISFDTAKSKGSYQFVDNILVDYGADEPIKNYQSYTGKDVIISSGNSLESRQTSAYYKQLVNEIKKNINNTSKYWDSIVDN